MSSRLYPRWKRGLPSPLGVVDIALFVDSQTLRGEHPQFFAGRDLPGRVARTGTTRVLARVRSSAKIRGTMRIDRSSRIAVAALFAVACGTASKPQKEGQVAARSASLSNALAVYVGYADNLRPSPDFPVPWQGSPNVVFKGGGTSFDAGAIRIDNPGPGPAII